MGTIARWAVILLLASSCVLWGQSEGDRLKQRLDPMIEKGLHDDPTPGLAVGVVHNGRVVYARGFGVMQMGHAEKPVTTETLFHMASVTKPFVATCVLQLWEQGKVDLGRPSHQIPSLFSPGRPALPRDHGAP